MCTVCVLLRVKLTRIHTLLIRSNSSYLLPEVTAHTHTHTLPFFSLSHSIYTACRCCQSQLWLWECLSKVSVRLRRLILTRRSPPEECHILIGLKENKGSERSTALTGINYLLPNGSQTQHSAILVLTLSLLPRSFVA